MGGIRGDRRAGVPLGVAQLSFWFPHADAFCVQAKETDGIRLVAVWDSDPARGQAKSREHDVAFIADLQELLERDDIQAVSVCAEPFRNPEIVEAAARAGKHVLIEKPMAGDLEGAERIVRAVESSGIELMPAYNLRFNPIAMRIKELVDAGIIGRVIRVRRLHGHARDYAAVDFEGRRVPEFLRWGDPQRERRNSLFWSGSHVALWFMWMFGAPESVQCTTTVALQGLPVFDNSAVIMSYADGKLGVIETSETLFAQASVAEIYGLDGAIVQLRGNLPSTNVQNTVHAPLMVYRRTEGTWEYPDLPPHFLRHEDAYSSSGQFLDALLANRPVPTDVYDGFDSIAILAAAEESSLRGKAVAVRRWPRPARPVTA